MRLLEDSIELLKDAYEITLVGSSLGGYYSIYLANKYNLKAVLINPAIDPCKTLQRFTGENKNFFDDSIYYFTDEYRDCLKDFACDIQEIQGRGKFLLLLQTGDELLDYQEAQNKFSGSLIDIEEGGSHEYSGFERKIPLIRDFYDFT